MRIGQRAPDGHFRHGWRSTNAANRRLPASDNQKADSFRLSPPLNVFFGDPIDNSARNKVRTPDYNFIQFILSFHNLSLWYYQAMPFLPTCLNPCTSVNMPQVPVYIWILRNEIK